MSTERNNVNNEIEAVEQLATKSKQSSSS